MKTYYFTCTIGFIGGSGVVKAPNKEEALRLANEAIMNEKVKAGKDGEPITENDLIELKSNTAVLITNGDY